MGSVNGVARHWQEQGRPLFVLWVDAHADYNTPQTTETGNMHGMSAAVLANEPGRTPPGVIAVVKANAYGHGSLRAGPVLERAGATMLACADIEEGVALRDAGGRGCLVNLPFHYAIDDAMFFSFACGVITSIASLMITVRLCGCLLIFTSPDSIRLMFRMLSISRPRRFASFWMTS